MLDHVDLGIAKVEKQLVKTLFFLFKTIIKIITLDIIESEVDK